MKRGAPEHPKMLVLAGELEKLLPPEAAPECELIAVGLVEKLLHWTPRYAIRGDVGKWADATIARALGWRRDPGPLIAALITSGWLDAVDGPERLVLHDCVDHADNVWRQCLDDAGMLFWDGSPPRKNAAKPKKTKQVKRDSSKTPVKLQSDSSGTPVNLQSNSNKTPQPEPEPEPVVSIPIGTLTTPRARRDAAGAECVPPPQPPETPPPPEPDHSAEIAAIAERIWQRHPKHRRGSLASAQRALCQALASAVQPATLAADIERRHAGWSRSDQWRRGMAMSLDRWLMRDDAGSCMTEPPPSEQDEWAKASRPTRFDENGAWIPYDDEKEEFNIQ